MLTPTSQKFETCWKLLLANEGGYTVDDGGATRWGVTARVAYAHGYRGAMQELPQATAEQIAQQEYWTPFQCELFPTAIAFQILDTAYNGGHPIQWLQQIVGGNQTGQDLADVLSFLDPWEVVARFNAKRLRYLASLRQQMYADGRMNRLATNLEQGVLQ
jgi:lysozyme family protein